MRTACCISSFVYKMAFWQSESNIFKTFFFFKGYLILYGADFIVTVSMKRWFLNVLKQCIKS